jgi:hypothetical protein
MTFPSDLQRRGGLAQTDEGTNVAVQPEKRSPYRTGFRRSGISRFGAFANYNVFSLKSKLLQCFFYFRTTPGGFGPNRRDLEGG